MNYYVLSGTMSGGEFMHKYQTISQRTAKDNLGNPEVFKGGCLVTKNGVAELFIQTAEERLQEEKNQQADKQANALLKLAMMAKEDVNAGRVASKDEVLNRLRAARS
ncbi:MAG: hypothetical protein ACJA13_000290 [Paraglaciecola sp.]|jgi:hypothetical protein